MRIKVRRYAIMLNNTEYYINYRSKSKAIFQARKLKRRMPDVNIRIKKILRNKC